MAAVMTTPSPVARCPAGQPPGRSTSRWCRCPGGPRASAAGLGRHVLAPASRRRAGRGDRGPGGGTGGRGARGLTPRGSRAPPAGRPLRRAARRLAVVHRRPRRPGRGPAPGRRRARGGPRRRRRSLAGETIVWQRCRPGLGAAEQSGGGATVAACAARTAARSTTRSSTRASPTTAARSGGGGSASAAAGGSRPTSGSTSSPLVGRASAPGSRSRSTGPSWPGASTGRSAGRPIPAGAVDAIAAALEEELRELGPEVAERARSAWPCSSGSGRSTRSRTCASRRSTRASRTSPTSSARSSSSRRRRPRSGRPGPT